MRVTAVETFEVEGGSDRWSFLKLSTDEGLVGWSEFNENRARFGISGVIREMARLVIGEDPRSYARLSAKLQRESRSQAGGLQTLAVGAYENAFLDLAAKALGVPVYTMLGGPMRNRLPVYWSHCGMLRSRSADKFEQWTGKKGVRSLYDIVELGREVKDRGFHALKTNLFHYFEDGRPAIVERGTDVFAMNIERHLVQWVVDQLESFREGAGPDVRLMMDINFNYKPEGFRRIAKAVEHLDMMWLEMDTMAPAALAEIRRSTSTPIASLEAIYGRRLLRPFLDAQAVDVAIIDPVFNGVVESLQMAAMADSYEVNVAAHNSHGPLGGMIAAQFCALIPNLRIMEIDIDAVPWRDELLTHNYMVENGEVTLPTGPGWGADIVEEVARAHATKRS